MIGLQHATAADNSEYMHAWVRKHLDRDQLSPADVLAHRIEFISETAKGDERKSNGKLRVYLRPSCSNRQRQLS